MFAFSCKRGIKQKRWVGHKDDQKAMPLTFHYSY